MISSSKNASKLWLPIGSPILDFLVTGDDFSIVDLLQQLGTNSTTTEKDVSDGLLSSINHGRPEQAVSNWVQCANPDYQKWRKIPWHVDIDMISEKFVCSDNLWGRNSCDEPDDYWDETTDAYVDVDGSIKPNETDRNSQDVTDNHSIEEGSIASCILAEFKVGGTSIYIALCVCVCVCVFVSLFVHFNIGISIFSFFYISFLL